MDISDYFLNWFYEPDTKLGIYFTGYSTTPTNQTALNSLTTSGVDYRNGLSACRSDTLILSSRITDHPVQDNSVISDNIINLPKVLNISGYLNSLKSLSVFDYLDFNQLGTATQSLIYAHENRLGISVVTGMLFGKSYLKLDNMAIERLEIPRTNNIGKTAILFNLTLKQINIEKLPVNAGAGFANAQVSDVAL